MPPVLDAPCDQPTRDANVGTTGVVCWLLSRGCTLKAKVATRR